MDSNISFATALQLLSMAYMTSAVLLLATSNVCLAIIETLEEVRD